MIWKQAQLSQEDSQQNLTTSKALTPYTRWLFSNQTLKSKLLQNSKLKPNKLKLHIWHHVNILFHAQRQVYYHIEIFSSIDRRWSQNIHKLLHLDLSLIPKKPHYICSDGIYSRNNWNNFDPKHFGCGTPNLSLNDDFFPGCDQKTEETEDKVMSMIQQWIHHFVLQMSSRGC